MFRHFIPSIEFWDNEQVAEEDYAKINLSKLNLIEHGNYKNPLLAGIAIGLLTQIYEMGGKDYFIPEVHFCGISLKDNTTPLNIHTDNWDENKIKVLGLLSDKWKKEDGGGFWYNQIVYPMIPTEFIIFDPNVRHSSDKIKSNKQRMAIDFTVTKL
tara:strand:+ start:170 stop:637 length:468 start_codon:yes stop_codon:yes gene_type:complete